MRVRRIARFAFVRAAKAWGRERLAQAGKCYDRKREAVFLGTLRVPGGLAMFLTPHPAGPIPVVGAAPGACFALWPERVIPR